jgi:hypothetical protein
MKVIKAKTFRVYARYKEETLKGGSGYDLLGAKDEIFDELNFWRDTCSIKREDILDIDYSYASVIAANDVPYYWLTITYEIDKLLEPDNFEDLMREVKELGDWNLMDKERTDSLISCFADFVHRGMEMSVFRGQLAEKVRKIYKERNKR